MYKEETALKNYQTIIKQLKRGQRRTVAVAAAADAEVIEVAGLMLEEGFADPVLVGNGDGIRALAKKAGLDPLTLRIVDEPDDVKAALCATALVRNGEADVLMKGLVNTGDFLRAVLDKEKGIRGEGILSHLAAFEIPGYSRLIIQTDGGMNPYPGLDEKAQILKNAVDALHKLGVKCPKVAALSANEIVNPKVASSADAFALARMSKEGRITGALVEGPIALDVALSADAAKRKKVESRIAGETDLYLVPNIDAGNIMGKTLVCLARAKMAGVVLGAKAPVALVSRSDNAESKLNSLALACALI